MIWKIDDDECIRCAKCVDNAEENFREEADSSILIFRQPDSETKDEFQIAVEECPVEAIIEEE